MRKMGGRTRVSLEELAGKLGQSIKKPQSLTEAPTFPYPMYLPKLPNFGWSVLCSLAKYWLPSQKIAQVELGYPRQ